ncbi:MAG TPA: TIGR03435 family protein [Acidobacteriaceae bacterium]|nr:TIGR03435 family protein [Acidobacteriaceae bacterium]
MAGLVAGLGLRGQVLHADSPLPSFDVATIRPSKGDSLRIVRSSSELQMLYVTARYLMEQAYNIPWTNGSKDRIRGGPGWMDSDHYDIDAKVGSEAAAALDPLPEQQRRTEMNLRLQTLLADRLKLKVHFETQQEPIFAIMVGKNGAKLTPASEAEGQHDLGIFVRYNGQAAQMTAKGVSLAELANWLTGYSEIDGQTVVDRTGLTQRYDFVLSWARERALTNGEQSGGSETQGGGPALSTALQEQLGLNLVNTRGPLEVIVVDSIERPTEN